jgi:4-diphosphocytidyl-2-C-methyl-D-erythritol kinase
MTHVRAHAKLNLALAVGPRREDGLHELVSVVQRIDLADDLDIEPAEKLSVEGFEEDTLVAAALQRLAEEAGAEPGIRVAIVKRVPLAAGLGGGSADAGAVLAAANQALPEPLPRDRLIALAADVGSDVPFFLEPGPKLVEGTGEHLTILDIPRDYAVVVALPRDAAKASTAEVYERFDELGGGADFERRRDELVHTAVSVRTWRDLALLPPNDLGDAAGRPAFLDDLRAAGAFRADVTGAGPAVYGLFVHREEAQSAARAVADRAETWVTSPVW